VTAKSGTKIAGKHELKIIEDWLDNYDLAIYLKIK